MNGIRQSMPPCGRLGMDRQLESSRSEDGRHRGKTSFRFSFKQSLPGIGLAGFGFMVWALLAVFAPNGLAEEYTYDPQALPQDSDPMWQPIGDDKFQASALEGVLRVESMDPGRSGWRLGRGQGGGGEYGSAFALPVEPGGAITVDFRVRIPNEDIGPNVPCFYFRFANGQGSGMVLVHNGEINLLRHTPMIFDTTQWVDCRLVLEGTKMMFYVAQSGDTRSENQSVTRDYGTFIEFGVPEWEAADAPRGFELEFLRWYPNQALYAPPEL